MIEKKYIIAAIVISVSLAAAILGFQNYSSEDHFAPGSFEDLSDEKKASSPSFEKFDEGFEIEQNEQEAFEDTIEESFEIGQSEQEAFEDAIEEGFEETP